jgi:hypothetical protein
MNVVWPSKVRLLDIGTYSKCLRKCFVVRIVALFQKEITPLIVAQCLLQKLAIMKR